MGEYREEVVTTTTTAAPPRVALPPITVSNPWEGERERVQQVTLEPDGARRAAVYRVLQLIWLVTGIAEGLIAIRFVLRLTNRAIPRSRMEARMIIPRQARPIRSNAGGGKSMKWSKDG